MLYDKIVGRFLEVERKFSARVCVYFVVAPLLDYILMCMCVRCALANLFSACLALTISLSRPSFCAVQGKTAEEIRKTFNIVNDFTPEEEAQVREENKWCEDA